MTTAAVIARSHVFFLSDPRDRDIAPSRQLPDHAVSPTAPTQHAGSFVCNNGRHDCAPGDVLFAPAGAVHRFEGCSADFCVWVVFYGPEGGEQP